MMKMIEKPFIGAQYYSGKIYSVASSLETPNGSSTTSAPQSAITTSLAGLSRPSVLVFSTFLITLYRTQ
jgi:hypothetical protein